MRKWLIIIVTLTALDLISKRIAEVYLTFGEPVSILPLLNMRLVYNTGAAFSLLSDAGGWQRWLFVVLAIGVCIYILNWLRKLKPEETLLGYSLTLILSGALGNLSDRIVYAKVTDFIDFYYPSTNECIYLFFNISGNSCHWPTFNFADIFISIGAILLIISFFREERSHETHSN
ncbi:MAG: signal peptidase II [Pseudomonadota bacterium]